MDALFDPRSKDILHYGPEAPVRWRARSRYLLWPVYGFRVVAPKVRATDLNVFEKAVLGLCQAGRTTPADIEERLLIDADLADLILMDLRNRECIDQDDLITRKGEDLLVLERGQPAEYQLAVGWVFRDPGSGKLWPRFVEELQYADIAGRSDLGFPHINVGSKGSPRPKRPFVHIRPRQHEYAVPTANEILEAVEGHMRASQAVSRQGEAQDLYEYDSPYVWDRSPSIKKITVISSLVQRFFVTTFAYVPESESWREWYVCDPFLPGGSSQLLRDEIEDSMPSSPKLKHMMEKFINRVPGDDEAGEEERVTDAVAEDTVNQKLSAVRVPDTLLEVLRPMERAYQEVGHNTRQDELKDVLVKAGIVLERLLGYILEQYPADGAHTAFLNNKRAFREELLNSLAREWGFHVSIPKRFSRAPAGGVLAAAEGRPSTLKCRVVAALLAARSYPTHPLRSAATTRPGLLRDLDSAITWRNRGAHDDRGRIDLENGVQEQVETTYRVVRLLLDDSP